MAGSEADADLLARVVAGDREALGALYARHHTAVRRALLRSALPHADADDLAHDAFITLARCAERYDGRASVRAFLCGIASRLARTHERRRCRRWRRSHMLAGDAPPPTPEEHAMKAGALRRLAAAFASLPPHKRETLLLVAVEGLSGEKAGSVLGVPPNTVWTRLHYARAELRRAIRDGARDAPDAGAPPPGSAARAARIRETVSTPSCNPDNAARGRAGG